jgi:hypothetical protein
MAEARHGMCELTRHDKAGKLYGKGKGAAWHGMCELALNKRGTSPEYYQES